MLNFPIHNAALDLKGKPPSELPHGLITPPAEVRELVEMQRTKLSPEVFAGSQVRILNLETIGWFFYDLDQPVVYRETTDGPEVLAVGREEMMAYDRAIPYEARPADLKVYRGYL